jgi:bifunctional non-homologous end joining protein LigD
VPLKETTARKTSAVSSNTTDQVTLEIEGQHVNCTRLSKILYPKAKFTKADVIDYYIRVAPFILPQLRANSVLA